MSSGKIEYKLNGTLTFSSVDTAETDKSFTG